MNGFKTDRHGFIHGNDTPHKGQDYRSDCGGVQVDQREGEVIEGFKAAETRGEEVVGKGLRVLQAMFQEGGSR